MEGLLPAGGLRAGQPAKRVADRFTDDPDSALLDATGQSSAAAALAWIGEGHPLLPTIAPHDVARAVLAVEAPAALVTGALERLARELAASSLDPAAVLHQVELLPDASRFREALGALAQASGGSLANISASSLRVAQNRNDDVMATLEALVGLTHAELSERVGGLPTEPRRPWTNAAVDAAFVHIDSLVRGQLAAPEICGAFIPLPVELMEPIAGPTPADAWAHLEQLRADGVPYELLLAQRVVGSSWGQHRNRTSQVPMRAVAQNLRDLLVAAGLDVVLSEKYGGDAKQGDLNSLVGGDKHVNLVVRTPAPELRPVMAVTFSLAKDGGSARKTLSAKIQMATPSVPVAVVVLGAGFARRNETVDLVRHFDGAVYTERTLAELTAAVAAAANT